MSRKKKCNAFQLKKISIITTTTLDRKQRECVTQNRKVVAAALALVESNIYAYFVLLIAQHTVHPLLPRRRRRRICGHCAAFSFRFSSEPYRAVTARLQTVLLNYHQSF